MDPGRLVILQHLRIIQPGRAMFNSHGSTLLEELGSHSGIHSRTLTAAPHFTMQPPISQLAKPLVHQAEQTRCARMFSRIRRAE